MTHRMTHRMTQGQDTCFRSSSGSAEEGDSIESGLNSGGDIVGRAELISKLRCEMAHAVGGAGGLARQDRLLKAWHAHSDDRELPSGPVVEDSSRISAFDESVASGTTHDSEPELERLPTGWRGLLEDQKDAPGTTVDSRMGGGLIRHGVHEWIGGPYQDSRGSSSFNPRPDRTSQASSADWIPAFGPVLSLLHRLQSIHDSMGRPAPRIAWIGHRCLPAPWNLLAGRRPPAFDIEACLRARHGSKPFFQEPLEEEVPAIDGRLLDHSLFITPPQDDRQARRWCLEQAVRATSIDAVVVDGSGFSPLDSRRLQVAIAERKRRDESPLLVLMVRPPCERLVRSSAITRWAVASSSTECPDDPRVAGWSVRLLRARMPQASPSMENAVVGQVHAEWDLHFDGPSKRVESASSSLVSSFASSCTSSSDDSVGSIKKETHVDTISFDPISMVGHRSGSATQSPSGNRSTTPQDERLFEEIVLPAERRQGVARGRRRHGIRSRPADSGGWNTSGWATSARMLFSGGSKGDSPRHDACRSEVAGDAGSRARGTVIADER